MVAVRGAALKGKPDLDNTAGTEWLLPSKRGHQELLAGHVARQEQGAFEPYG
jgi:hypothetical protein